MNGTFTPQRRPSSAISSSSVLRITCESACAANATSVVYCSRGLPSNERTFLRATPFEPPRAGIKPSIRDTDFVIDSGGKILGVEKARQARSDSDVVVEILAQYINLFSIESGTCDNSCAICLPAVPSP